MEATWQYTCPWGCCFLVVEGMQYAPKHKFALYLILFMLLCVYF